MTQLGSGQIVGVSPLNLDFGEGAELEDNVSTVTVGASALKTSCRRKTVKDDCISWSENLGDCDDNDQNLSPNGDKQLVGKNLGLSAALRLRTTGLAPLWSGSEYARGACGVHAGVRTGAPFVLS